MRVAAFFGEIALIRFGFLDFLPSVVALAVIVVASTALGWPSVGDGAVRIADWTDREELMRCTDLLKTEAQIVMKNWKNPMEPELHALLAGITFLGDCGPMLSVIER
jgi:hypothetical protein